jgi:hypothetical protein
VFGITNGDINNPLKGQQRISAIVKGAKRRLAYKYGTDIITKVKRR